MSDWPKLTLERDMRIMPPDRYRPKVLVKSLPLEMFDGHAEQQAERNHGQTLRQLNGRGGLGASEAIAVLVGHAWVDMPHEFAHRMIYFMRVMLRRGQRIAEGKSVDALLAQIPADWRVGMEKLPIDDGPRWSCWARPHAADGFRSDCHDTLAAALQEVVALIEKQAIGLEKSPDERTDRVPA